MFVPIPHIINIDLSKIINTNKSIIIKKNDTNSHLFKINITDNGVPYPLTGSTARIYLKKADKNKLFSDCTMDDAANGKITYLVETQAVSYAGIVSSEITIYGPNGEILTTVTFIFVVTPVIRDDSAIESTSEFTALTNALNKIDVAVENIGTIDTLNTILEGNIATGDTLDVTLKDDIATGNATDANVKASTVIGNATDVTLKADIVLAGQNSFAAEVTAGRGSFANLKARSDKVDADLAQKALQTSLVTTNNVVALKADKSYVDAQNTLKTNDTPKGQYDSLALLQSTFPTGTTGKYIIGLSGAEKHSYIYMNSAWTDFGVYQGIGISTDGVLTSNITNGAVIKEKLEINLQNCFTDLFTKQDIVLTNKGYYINQMGSQVTSTASYYSNDVVVSYGEIYILTSYSIWGACRYILYDSTNKIIVYDNHVDNILYSNTKIIIPSNVVKMTLQTDITKGASFYLSKRSGYDLLQNSSVGLNNLNTALQNSFQPVYTVQNPIYNTNGAYGRDGVLAFPGYSNTIIYAKAGDKYKITGYDYYACPLYIIRTNGVITSYPTVSTQGNVNQLVDITMTEDCTLIVNKNLPMNKPVTILKSTSYQMSNNPLFQKTMYSDGDSVADGVEALGISYANIISLNNVMMLTKKSLGGTTLAVKGGQTNSILERVKVMTNSYDYILVQGGYNDLMQSLPLGMLSIGFIATLVETTVIGAVESICKTLITNYPIAKKLFILGHRLTTNTPVFGDFPNQNSYWDAIISALEKWSIPYVDLRKSSNLCGYNDVWLTNYFNGSSMGLHPNYNGYLYFYVPQIESKLKTL
ncbi:SGNH/GDSL hydrolase family protein [Clostridium lacusfryxellense]|uniref:SGNH/GDSL hydrolase family protein n=1 Tax=Clostridium lacusfryxellense TaxID=205328 RepID=UPI001C0BABDB|nr:SGNH/GDSL hydrolase family protein [Clostridium lacusfryxellense]MBU3112011.1 BppU family phage baseplate upper protein [Clostridium lacusfryxellense]